MSRVTTRREHRPRHWSNSTPSAIENAPPNHNGLEPFVRPRYRHLIVPSRPCPPRGNSTIRNISTMAHIFDIPVYVEGDVSLKTLDIPKRMPPPDSLLGLWRESVRS